MQKKVGGLASGATSPARNVKLSSNELVFVVETCQNCKEHHWNTRHDEAKYLDFFNRVSTAITQRLPNALVLRNQIPKSYLNYDIYCNLIPNDDETLHIYDQVPRTGAFEVSYKGMLIFSKLQSGWWPNSQLIGEKCMLLVRDEKDQKDLSKYLAGSPLKGSSGSGGKGKAGRNQSRSPLRGNESSLSKQQQHGTSLGNIQPHPGSSHAPLRINEKFQQQTPGKQQSLPTSKPTPQPPAVNIQDDSKYMDDAEEESKDLSAGTSLADKQHAEEEQLRLKKQAEAAAAAKAKAEAEAASKKAKEDEEAAKKKKAAEEEERKAAAEKKRKEEEEAAKKAAAQKEPSIQEEEDYLPAQKSTVSQDPKFLTKEQAKNLDTVPVNDIQKIPSQKIIQAHNAAEFAEEANEIEPEKDVLVGRELKAPEDLLGYPTFPEGTKSLLKKHLTREIWNELKGKLDKVGFTFKAAIFSGCKNTDSGIGVYAGSHDSYSTFASLFDKIILDYHGHKKEDIHQSDMDYQKLVTPPFSENEAKHIKSTRIRVGRNLADYPLGPGLTKEQRKEIETKVVQALTTFEGELQGKYYSLSSLTEEERKQLIDDHFLFKEGDRFLKAVGLNRDWPDARGIFHNKEKSFLVWVNEEDQLRIISMQQGADIGAVFTRLSKACAHIEKVAKFSHDKHLGYITSCPTNLGTALRASVHIHLPYLGLQKAEFQAIADKYHVQIRGAHGEHTETDDHIYDISNKRRLGRSEVDLVQDMYNGVKAMINREFELAPKPKVEEKPVEKPQEEEKDVQVGPQLKSSKELTGFPVFPEGIKSLLKKNLTKEIWNKYKNEQDKFGFTFKKAIFSGCQNTDSSIGVYAGSHDSYHKFADFFDKIVLDYHGHKKEDKHVSDMDYKKLNTPPLPEEDAKMIKSTRIRVGRNLADYPLGPGLSKEQRKEIEAKVVQALSKFDGELEGKFYALTSLSEQERKQLIDDHFLFKEGDRFLEAVGLNRDWPDGRGIFHNKNKTFLVWVNEEDQLRIISMQQGADIGAVFARLSQACAKIEQVAKFSHDEHLGYITSCPTNLGTALRASVHIHLPFLGKQKADFQAIADSFHVQIRGAHGEHTETDDHIYDISNKRRLGRSEVDLVQDMYNGVKAMIEKEKALKPKEIAEKKAEVKLEVQATVPEQKKEENQEAKPEEQKKEQKEATPQEEKKQEEITAVPEGPKEVKHEEKPATQKESKEVEAGKQLKSPADLVGFPKFPAGTKSLLSKYLTKELWEKLDDVKDKHGFTFKEAIFSGSKNTDSGIGVYAGSHDSYHAFADLFDKIILDYHGHKKEDKHVSDMDYHKLSCPPFKEEEAKLIKSTRIRVGRNLADYPLGPGLSKEQRKEIETKVVQALTTFEGELDGKYYALTSLTEEQRKQLIEDHFLFKEGDRFLKAAGLNRDWPDSRGIYHNNDKTFLVWVNEEDQLRIISMQQGADIGAVFARLSKACAHIETVAKFAHDEHLGYITSCPTNLGTALRASVHIQLPKLGIQKAEFEAIADKYHVQIRGIHGEHSESDDHIYDISNKRRLGHSEVSLIQDMYNGVKAMIEKEISL